MIYNDKGFTLIEVLLAVMLMGVALIPIIQIMPGMYRTNEAMVIENKLAFFAQDKLEEVKGSVIGEPYNFNNSRNESATPFPESGYWYEVIGDDSGGIDIDNPDDGNNDIKIITVHAWYGDSGSVYADAEHKIELKTKVSYRAT